MLKLNEYFKLIRLSRNRLKSQDSVIKFQNYQARLILKELNNKGIDIKDLKIIELGCGKGGYSLELYKKSKNLTIADIRKPDLFLKRYPKVKFTQFDFSKKFPLEDKQFDFIFCSNIIEHIKNPLFFLRECERILKPGGLMFLSFPPFYSPHGGHSVKPFHYLGEKLSIKINNKLRKTQITKYEKMFGTWGMYKLKIKDVKNIIKKTNLEIKNTWVKYSPINFAKIPFLDEILTWHVCFILHKKN